MKTPFTFTAPIRAQAGKPRRVQILAYSGGLLSINGYPSEVLVDMEGLYLPNALPLLLDHQNEIGSIAGTGRPRIENNVLYLEGELSTTDAGKTVAELLSAGTPLGASIGASPEESTRFDEGEQVSANGKTFTAGPRGIILIKKSSLKEVSIVAIAADSTSSVISAKAKGKSTMTKIKAALKAMEKYTDEEIDGMSEDEAKAALKKCMGGDEPEDDNPESKKADASFIVELMGEHCDKKIMAQALQEKWSVREVRRQALADLRASRPGAGVGLAHHGRSLGGGHRNSQDSIMAALMLKCGFTQAAEKTYGANALNAMQDAGLHRASLRDIYAAHLQNHGVSIGVSATIEEMIRASTPSSANLSNLLSNVMNKQLEQQWPQSPGTWRLWSAIRSTPDLKPARSLRPVFSGDLTFLHPSGEIESGSLEDSMISWQAYTFAKLYTISRNAIINDDLGALAEIPLGLTLMADRAVSDLAYYNLLSNPSSFFSTDNSNIQTTGSSALSSASLKLAIAQMRSQRGPNDALLAIPPATLIVGPTLEQVAKELLHSSFMFRDQSADRQGTANAWENIVNLAIEPRVEFGCNSPVTGATATGAATKWFLFANSTYLPAIAGFRNGAQYPAIEASDPLGFNFQIPGQSYRCIFDFGHALGDFRACQYAAGA